jgi:alkylhydroperoxidase family enzyme
MAWISTVPDDPSTPDDVAELYDLTRDRDSGEVDNIMSIHSLHPKGLAAHNSLYTAVMGGTKTLRKVEREMIALVVSLENQCHY